MARLVVLEALDGSDHVTSKVADDCSIAELCSKLASNSGVHSADFLVRKGDGTIVSEDATAAELCGGERGAILTAESKVTVRLLLSTEADAEDAEEADMYTKGNGSNGLQNGDTHDPKGEASVWLSCEANQLVPAAREVFVLDLKRPLRFFLGGEELQLERSLEEQGVTSDMEVEVRRHLRGERNTLCFQKCSAACTYVKKVL